MILMEVSWNQGSPKPSTWVACSVMNQTFWRSTIDRNLYVAIIWWLLPLSFWYMGVSINGGTPNGWFIVENPIKMDDVQVALF